MPARSVDFHPEAARDAENARQWYQHRSAIAARADTTELSTSVERISEAPDRWPRYLAGTRRLYFPNFPFSLIYRVAGDKVTIVAVAHHRKKPDYWLRRR